MLMLMLMRQSKMLENDDLIKDKKCNGRRTAASADAASTGKKSTSSCASPALDYRLGEICSRRTYARPAGFAWPSPRRPGCVAGGVVDDGGLEDDRW